MNNNGVTCTSKHHFSSLLVFDDTVNGITKTLGFMYDFFCPPFFISGS